MTKADLEVLRQTPILAVAQALGHEVFRGNVIRCPVPEAHPKGYVRPTMGLDLKRNRVKCFACGKSGSALDLVMWSKHCTLAEAATFLTQIASGQSAAAAPIPVPKPEYAGRLPNPEDLAVFQSFFDLCALCEDVPEVQAYLDTRLLPMGMTYARFGLRAVSDPVVISAELRQRHTESALCAAGIMSDDGRFRFGHHRLILFYLKTDGRPYYFQARHLGGDHPRFLNPCGVRVPCLMAQIALKGMRPGSELYLTEGMFDTLSIIGMGAMAVGVPGVEFLTEQLVGLLRKYRVTYIPQNDGPGLNSIKDVERLLRRVTVLRLPIDGADVNDHLRRLGEESLFDLLFKGEGYDE